jgi:hypothetical protein
MPVVHSFLRSARKVQLLRYLEGWLHRLIRTNWSKNNYSDSSSTQTWTPAGPTPWIRRLATFSLGVVSVSLASCDRSPEKTQHAPAEPAASAPAPPIRTTSDVTVLGIKLGAVAPAACELPTIFPCLGLGQGKPNEASPQFIRAAGQEYVRLDPAITPDGVSTRALAGLIDGDVEMLLLATSKHPEHIASIFDQLEKKWGPPHRSELDLGWRTVLQGSRLNKEIFSTKIWDFSELRITYIPIPQSGDFGTILVETPASYSSQPEQLEGTASGASGPPKRF